MKPKLMAPVSSYAMLATAINSGCDAIYFGIKGMNMREGARNFGVEDIKPIAKKCKEHQVEANLALNTIIYDENLEKIDEIIRVASDAGINSVICWDHAVIQLAKQYGLRINLSTQASVSNFEALKFYYDTGVKTFTLARELSLQQIKQIRRKINLQNLDVELECFVHGAMCVSVSDRCFLSQFSFNKSANTGECIQPCRRSFVVRDPEEGHEYDLHNNYILSPKDLCTLPFIEQLIEAGIDIFKIEGRGRRPEYVKTVVEAYKAAITAYHEKKLTDELKNNLTKQLKEVYNRGFSSGFYLGKPLNEWCKSYGNQAEKVKVFVGEVVNFYKTPMVAEIKLNTGKIEAGDTLLVIGNKTGVVKQKVESMEIENQPATEVEKGQSVGIRFDNFVRKNDQVYVWQQRT